MRKEFKYNNKEIHEPTREREKEERNRNYKKKPENNYQNDNQYVPINNYFKYKCTIFFNQKT